MLIRTVHLLEFLEAREFYRLRNYPVLDVAFTDTTWVSDKSKIEIDLYEDVEWMSLTDKGVEWERQEGGAALFNDLVEWATALKLRHPPVA